jgi:DNA repair protein RadC
MPRRQEKTVPAAQADFAHLLFPEGQQPAGPGEGGARDEPPPGLARESLPARPEQHLPIFGVKLVRTGSMATGEQQRSRMNGPAEVAALLWRYFRDTDREHFAALLLDTKNRLIGVTTVSVGDLSSVLVHPREVFKPAILANAASVILAHNHPSGDPQPSPEDVAITRRLQEAGQILGIEVLDHVVVGEANHWVSLREKGLM